MCAPYIFQIVTAMPAAAPTAKPLPRSIPTDLSGKPIPQSQRWAYSPSSFTNGDLLSIAANAAVIGAFISFNTSTTGHQFYTYLDTTYGAYKVNVWGTFIVTSVFFWAWAGLFALADLTGSPHWLFRYKTQPFARVSGAAYLRIAAVSLRNQVLVAFPMLLLSTHLGHALHPVAPEYLPSPTTTLTTLLFDVACTEIGFYYIHRTLHHGSLYPLFHKQHHEFTAPVGLAATHCTATEHILSNLLPNALGTLLVRHHWSQAVFIFLFLEFNTICVHSGYNIPGLPSNLKHDFHHFAFTENFGPTGVLDMLHSTNRRFKSVMADAIARTGGDEERARVMVLERLARVEMEVSNNKE